jgi:hypothetical protein
MARTIDTSTAAALLLNVIYPVFIIRLDIVNDPVYIHTGIGSLTFAGGSGYDPNLVGFTFLGVGNIGEIGSVTDSIDGSQTMNLSLPGVDLTMDYLHQIINNADLWQRRQAWVWLATFDNTGALIGKPIRIKTGRMDQMPIEIDPDSHKGTLSVSIESQQAYSGEALFSRYSEQSQIDATDTSENFVAALANKVPEIGNTSSNASGGPVAVVFNQVLSNVRL